ncbi:erythromycin esterase family protein [Catenuloplanes japonicus]|uniref:erythromycin esterase family protein n=1 Tax=Catenuloplanes japonicus TaxID=33876 RepID=UPI00068D2FAD|nr:erythromycin esterase family protein [Catenuloplanes japonicus]
MRLDTLDPTAPLDDLEPLRAAIGGARVVAIGETSHHVREYQLLRHRLLRFLVERMGFTAYAQESGFSEGLALAAWVAGGPGDFPADGLTYRFGNAPETRATFAWMRASGAVRYTGLDLPGDLASMLPALDRLDVFGKDLVDAVRELAARWAGPHTMPAFAAYLAMPQADRDAQTVLLAALSTHADALRPLHLRTVPAAQYETTRHELRLAVLLDQQLRAQARSAAGSVTHLAVNARDAAMAETARMLLARGERLVIGAANSHLARVPLPVAGLEIPTLGTHLAADLGDDLLVIALTTATGRIMTRRRSATAPEGAEFPPVDLEPPADGSIESLLATDAPVITDVRALSAARIRVLDTYQDLPVARAYDLVACLPAVTPTTR